MPGSNYPDPPVRASISWEGDSLDVLKVWPSDVRRDIGHSLRRLQEGESPDLPTRPMQSIGHGVFELKTEDEAAWYRVIYLARIKDKIYVDKIYVLDSFTKKSRKTEKNDLNRARARLSRVTQRLQKEKSDAKDKRNE
jgi:phage-related protein